MSPNGHRSNGVVRRPSGKRKKKNGPLPEAVEGSEPDRPKELVVPGVLHDQLSNLRPIMDWNRFFESLFALSLAPVAVTAQPQCPIAPQCHDRAEATVYQSIAKTQIKNGI